LGPLEIINPNHWTNGFLYFEFQSMYKIQKRKDFGPKDKFGGIQLNAFLTMTPDGASGFPHGPVIH
jgi:hypothetical protein